MRKAHTMAAAASLLGAAIGAAQTPVAGGRLYRMFQGGAEVGRETYRRSAAAVERSVVVPILNLKLDSRTDFDSAGRLARFEARAFNAAGDSLRGSYTVVARGDSLHVTTAFGTTTRTRSLALRADGIVPAQSVSVIQEVIDRAAGRDTTMRYLPMGLDSTVAISVAFGSDSVLVNTAGIPATVRRDGVIDVTVQRLRAEIWNGRDSLAPLSGLRRPTPDYSAPPGAPYTAREVRIPIRTVAGDTLSLAGTLTLPVAGRRPFPVVVTISGSGPQPRDEDLWPLVHGYRPFRQIAERLATEGIAVLRYDDRGVDGSGRGDSVATTADYADDVRQIVEWLRARSDIAARRVALLGHSEGGAIGPLVAAADARLGALVVMAGPAKTGRAIIRDQFRRPIETAPELSAEQRAAALADVDRRVEEWAGLNKWTRWFADWDPLATARRIRPPVLILHGALDRQVSVGQADTLGAALRAGGNSDVTVRVWPRLNHLFLPTEGDGSPAEYPALKDTALPQEVLDAIAGWLRARLVTRGR